MEGLGRATGRRTNQPQNPPPRRPANGSNGGGNGGVTRRDFQPAPAPTASVWGQPVAAATTPGGAWGQPATSGGGRGAGGRGHANLPASQAIDKAVRYGAPAALPVGGEGRATMHRVVDTGSRDATAPSDVARGAVRGRRMIADIICTKPKSIASKKGESGRPVALQTNYFKLLKKPAWCLYQYRVDFSPDIELEGLRKRFVYEQKPTFQGYLFDGTGLFLTHKLQNEITDFTTKDREGNPYVMKVKFVGLISMNTAQSVQILNIILRRSMEGLQLQLVGRNFFDAVAAIKIPEYRIELWPGYITSIRQHEQDILLCAEVTNKVMRNENCLEVIASLRADSRNFSAAVQNALLGITVLTDYNNKTYRIDDVDFEKNPTSTFDTKDGPKSYLDYYQQRYNLRIRDMQQPLLISRVKAKALRNNPNQTEVIGLIPELCRVTGLTEQMTSNYRLMTALSKYTRLVPNDRIEKLLQYNARLKNTPASVDVLTEWNMKLDSKLVELPGRILKPEVIIFGGDKKITTDAKADWTYDIQNSTMRQSVHLTNWCFIYVERASREAREFAEVLIKAASSLKYNISMPIPCKISDDRLPSYINAIDSCINKDPQMIMLLVPNSNSDRYSSIKKKCCVERAIPTQVMVYKTITPKGGVRKLMSVATKVAIQMNCKLGGAPWMIDLPIKEMMTIGFDVCHDTKDKKKSYGAMVATMDMQQTSSYYSTVSAHTNGEELSNEFSINVLKALKEYRNRHGKLPLRIIVYRDGVGEGQTDYVFEHEVQLLRTKLDETYKNADQGECKLAFIVVSKRINTRFFYDRKNPPPGTVIDDVVTLPERYDFFLVSQSCQVGTVSPTSYNVLHDSFGLPTDRLQILTYKMTHLYYNWTGTLRVPAVCQYAHKLAFLVGQYIHQSPSHLLEKQLYFL